MDLGLRSSHRAHACYVRVGDDGRVRRARSRLSPWRRRPASASPVPELAGSWGLALCLQASGVTTSSMSAFQTLTRYVRPEPCWLPLGPHGPESPLTGQPLDRPAPCSTWTRRPPALAGDLPRGSRRHQGGARLALLTASTRLSPRDGTDGMSMVPKASLRG